MVKNYLKVAFRNILKSKIFSIVNILGLAIGTAAFLLILEYVKFELSYDKFLPESSNIYRVSLAQYLNGDLMTESAENYPAVGPAMLADLPEVSAFARLYNMGYKNNLIITYEEAPSGPVMYKHRRFLYADSAFLPMFGYEMAIGDATNALAEPYNVVISEKYAKMYFGDEEPLGKMLRLRDDDFNDEICKVTGVFKDLPENTHLKFDVLFSYKTLFARGDWAPGRYNDSWARKDMYTYVKLKNDVDKSAVEAKLPVLVNTYSPKLAESGRKDVLSLQPLEDIHLYSSLADEPEANASGNSVYALGLIAIFILIIAWVNYINLSTAKAMDRANEVGVRKALGAFRQQLIGQFLAESAIINLISLLGSILIILLVLPLFNDTSGLSLTWQSVFTGKFFAICVLLWLVGTLLSGVYPSLFLSSFKPVKVLKGKLRNSGKGALLRKSLVVFQFVASVALISGTLIVDRQLKYMHNQDLGMNIDQVLVVERPGVAPRDRDAFNSNVDVFRDELSQNPDIKGVSTSMTIPGKKREYKVGMKKYGSADDEAVTLRMNSMDYDFVDVFGMEVVAGRAFSAEHPHDTDTSLIITQSAAEMLGYTNPEDAVGQTLVAPSYNWSAVVVGVVNDYHQESLQKAKDPILFYCTLYGGEFYSIKVNSNNIENTVTHVEQSWKKAFPGNPFSYFFLDDYFNRQYENENKFGKLFASFSLLAIIIGCLGLFGLSAFTVQQKTKEIGVRKVLGSSVSGIFVLLSKDFIKLILIAVIIAVPITYYGMGKWLEGFAYKDDIALWVFAIAGVAVVLTALITVSFQTIRAARVNPVDSLRYE